MSDPQPQFLEVADPDGRVRRIAYLNEPRDASGRPGLVWLCGFNSVMTSTKVSALADCAAREGHSLLRFDYSGHGASGGEFAEGTIGRWLEDAMAVLKEVARGPQILVGSSMGGWIALLILRAIAWGESAAENLPEIRGAVLIAPAWDMTEELMWKEFSPEARAAIEREGVFMRPSPYGDGPYPITRALIEEGRRHLVRETPFDPGCPVRILQGLKDPDVPWRHVSALNTILVSDDIETLFIPEGEHRLSRPEDIEKLLQTITDLYESKAGSGA
jgi:pimeloyl-ACP methyl ester carboxylesterase